MACLFTINRSSVLHSMQTAFHFSRIKTSLITNGFNDWQNIYAALKPHEQSSDHGNCMTSFAHLSNADGGRVDSSNVVQVADEKRYWRSILKCVVATDKFLAFRGLAFRGKNETFGSPHNGNFLGALKLLVEF